MAKKKGPTDAELDEAYRRNADFNSASAKYSKLTSQIQKIRAQIKALNKQVVKGISPEKLSKIQAKRKALEEKQAKLKKERQGARQAKRVAATGQGGT